MNRKTTGIVAGAAGAALLIGGGTFALWSDSAAVEDNELTLGNLAIAAAECGEDVPAWIDASDDRIDAGHTIDLATWRGVPGDVVEGSFCFSAALEGDNLVAALEATFPDAEDVSWYSVDYELLALQDDEWAPVDGLFTTLDNESNEAELPTLPATIGDANVKVVVTVSISDTITGTDHVTESIDLAGFDVELNQVRNPEAAGQGGFVGAP